MVYDVEILRLLRGDLHEQRKQTRELLVATREIVDVSLSICEVAKHIRDACQLICVEMKLLREALTSAPREDQPATATASNG